MAGIWDGGSNLEEYDLRMRLISYIFRNVSRLIELRWYCCTDFGNTKWSNALNHCKSKHNSRRRSLPNKLALKTEVFMAIMLRDCAKLRYTPVFFYHQQILSSWNFYRFLFVPDKLTRLSNFFYHKADFHPGNPRSYHRAPIFVPLSFISFHLTEKKWPWTNAWNSSHLSTRRIKQPINISS